MEVTHSRLIPQTLEQTDTQLMQISPGPQKNKYEITHCNYFSNAPLKLHVMEMISIPTLVLVTQGGKDTRYCWQSLDPKHMRIISWKEILLEGYKDKQTHSYS